MGDVERHVLRLQLGGGVLGLITWRWSSRQPSPLGRLAEDQAGEPGMGLATAEALNLLGVGMQRRLPDGSDHAITALLQQLRQNHLGDLAAHHTNHDQLDHLAKRHAVVAMFLEG